MAGGKLSPRQKMINLMYLVLLALLAMQVSVEVMEAFSKIYYRSENAIDQSVEKNEKVLLDLERLSKENPAQYKDTYEISKQVYKESNEFVAEVQILKDKIKELFPPDSEKGKLPATEMGKGDKFDEYLFAADGYTPEGDKFVKAVDGFRSKMLKLIGDQNPSVTKQIEDNFNTAPVPSEEDPNVKKDWLSYNFKGLPAIGSIAILSSMQNTVLGLGNESLTGFLAGRLKKASSASNLQAFVKLDKNTYSPGDKVTAEVFLASKDDSKIPNKVEINGANIDLKNKDNFKGGKVIYTFRAGGIGDKPILGQFTFIEKGQPITVDIKGNYSVVAGSNQAIISADKMNVVYRGLENPITITMPGISPTKVKAVATGLVRKSGTAYVLRPGKGKTVSVNVSAVTDKGEKIKSPPVTFRIKDIPQAMASIRGEYGSIKMPKGSLAKSSINAGLPDFVFDLKLRVKSFKVKVPGKTTVIVNGGRMNSQAQKAIAGAKRGDIVTVFGIRASIVGNSSYRLKEVLPISVEISN